MSAEGSYSNYSEDSQPSPMVANHLDELTTCMSHLEQQAFDQPLVHLIDREGDSVGHIRQSQRAGYYWLRSPISG